MELKVYAKISGANLMLIYNNLTLHNTVIPQSTKVSNPLRKIL